MTRILAQLILVCLATTVEAQVSSGTDDSQSAAGYEAGRRAAETPAVGLRGLGGFASGVAFGSIGPVAIYGRNKLALGVSLSALGGLIASSEAGSARPPNAILASLGRGEAYRTAFIDGYESRLKHRRRSAAFIGAATGTAVGLGGLLVFLLQVNAD